MEEAVRRGATTIFLPEHFSFLTGPRGYADAGEHGERGPGIRFLQEFAREYGVHIVGGSIPTAQATERVRNTCFVVGSSGQIRARYDKMHLFDVDLDSEHRLRESDEVEPGADIVTVSAGCLKIGLSICYDLRFPELYRRLLDNGVNVLSIPSNFTVPTGRAHWEILLRARAIENQCFVVAPAQCGTHPDAPASYGHSMIVDPWGKILAEAKDEPGVLVAGLDLDHLTDIRRRLPSLEHRKVS
jgi:predicted amidohydrolase